MKYTSSDIQPADQVAGAPVANDVLPEALDGTLQAYSPLQMHFLARL
jgi:hypothetical protein